MNLGKIFNNIGVGTYTPTPSPIKPPDEVRDLSKKTGGRGVSTSPPPPPPAPKFPRGRLVPMECIDEAWHVEVHIGNGEYVKIDSTNVEWHGRHLIEDYFKNKARKERGIIYVD